MASGAVPESMTDREPDAGGRDPASLARGYYRSMDVGDYEALAALLAPVFTQVRGDRTIEGREAFVRFVAEERPETDTTHEIDAVYREEGGPEVAIRGRLLRADGSVWFGFVDVFEVADGRLARLVTYTNDRAG